MWRLRARNRLRTAEKQRSFSPSEHRGVGHRTPIRRVLSCPYCSGHNPLLGRGKWQSRSGRREIISRKNRETQNECFFRPCVLSYKRGMSPPWGCRSRQLEILRQYPRRTRGRSRRRSFAMGKQPAQLDLLGASLYRRRDRDLSVEWRNHG